MSIATSLEVHPLALRVPGMTSEEYVALRDDIAANGLAQAITMFEGKILDGRHRYRACEETETTPRFEEYEGDSPATFVLSLNGKRRHLSTGQLAMLAMDFLPDLESEAKARQGSRTDLATSAPFGADVADRAPKTGRAAEHAGELVGVSPRSVQRAKRIADADPELAARVRDGHVAINTADEMVAGREAKAPTRDGSRKRKATELVTALISRLDATPAVLREIDTASAITAEGAPLAEWDKKLTDVIQSLNRLRGDIRKEMGNA